MKEPISVENIEKLMDRDEAMSPTYDLEKYAPICPACGAPAVVVNMDTTYRFNFCPKCGQRLDWRVKRCETCKWWKSTDKRYDSASDYACANSKSKHYHEITTRKNCCEEWEEE